MRQTRIAFIVIVLCLFLTVGHAQAGGYYSGCCYSGCYWALPLLFLGVPLLTYALSGGYSGTSAYLPPSYHYYESPSRTYQRTYYRTVEVARPLIPKTPALQMTVGDPSYRYYCRSPRGYYPDVMNCPLGWKKAAPAYNPIDHKADR
jgi:hypothetical protein